MPGRSELIREIDALPPECVGEVLSFIGYVKHRKRDRAIDCMLMSEALLARDWDSPEEDAAWAEL